MKLHNRNENSILTAFRQTCPTFTPKAREQVHLLQKMRGRTASRILCIAPPFSREDARKGLPFADASATVFHNLLAHHNVSTERDMLIISASRFLPLRTFKPNKQGCQPTVDFIQEVIKLNHFRMFVCIGDEAFKHIFALGRKANMQTLVGNLIYLGQLKHTPLFTFPSLDGLILPENSRPATFRWHEKVTKKHGEVTKRFAQYRKHILDK